MEITFSGTGSYRAVNDEMLKDPTEVGNAFSNFFYLFIIITEKIKHSKNRERKCYMNSKRFISWKIISLTIVPITET